MITFLEAVNICLASIGEAPVNRLSDPGINEVTDSAHAQRTLNETMASVQSEGWSWNTARRYVIMPTASNTFNLPPATLVAHFSGSDYGDNRYVAQGLQVLDTFTYSTTIADQPGGLTVDKLVLKVDWDLMPHAAQHYCSIRAARLLQDRYVNSNALYAYTSNDEEAARAVMLRQENESGRNNMLWSNRSRRNNRGPSFVPADGTRYRIN